MSNDREQIFASIRKALDPLPESKRSAYPEWTDDLPVCRPDGAYADLKAQFAHKLDGASSKFFDSIDVLSDYLKSEEAIFGYCDPQFAGYFAGKGLELETDYDMAKINQYAFGITKGSAGVAESGTIMLKDGDTSARLGALAPWIHIAVIEEKDILASLPEAIQRFGDDPSIVWATGPSKTADVEGILIQGVHGPGVQIALVV